MEMCFVLYMIPVCALLYVLIYEPMRKYYVPVKTIASLSFIGLAVYYTFQSGNQEMLFRMLPGFILCFCGDEFLGFYNRIKNKKLFLAGIATFLTGHICFIGSLLSIQKLSLADMIFPIGAIGIAMFTVQKKKMTLGKLKPYVYVYTFFVALLFSKSVHIFIDYQGLITFNQALCLALGAALFLISDFLILFLYFYDKRPWSTHGWNLVTYYLGMFFLAASLLW